jgi:hypothetical protein
MVWWFSRNQFQKFFIYFFVSGLKFDFYFFSFCIAQKRNKKFSSGTVCRLAIFFTILNPTNCFAQTAMIFQNFRKRVPGCQSGRLNHDCQKYLFALTFVIWIPIKTYEVKHISHSWNGESVAVKHLIDFGSG